METGSPSIHGTASWQVGGENRTAGVCFDEIRLWLCDVPGSGEASGTDIQQGENKNWTKT